MRRAVYIHWGISSYFGYGVYGLNLALAWARDPDLAPVCTHPIVRNQIQLDPLRASVLAPFVAASDRLAAEMAARPGQAVRVPAPMLVAVNNDFTIPGGPSKASIVGQPMIGVPFFMDVRLSPEAVDRARRFPVHVAGSTWNADLMKAQGIENVQVVLQGVDPTLFHPAPKAGWRGDRFIVFSGGKVERRKAQDIVLKAFRVFAERHADALLMTAWHSPWPEHARSLDESGLVAPVAFDDAGRLDVKRWAAESGLQADQVLDLGPVPNAMLPTLLREADVALFPNRCEPGTNLVAMEAMACGVPAILSANTGHLDLIEEGNCLALTRQGEVAGQEASFGVPGWGESSLEETVEALEQAYRDREAAREIGLRGAKTLAAMTWANTAAQMKAVVLAHA